MKTYIIQLLVIFSFLIGCTPTEGPPVDDIQTPPESRPPKPIDPIQSPLPPLDSYTPIGVGGGGAMSGVAISPYTNLWFVGTDMGTLFRSYDYGVSWRALDHFEADFHSDLLRAVSPGFSSDGKTIFHASRGINPKRSLNQGTTFQSMKMNLVQNEYIKYWHSHSLNENIIYAGTNKGFLISPDKGNTWMRSSQFTEEAIGTFVDLYTDELYQAGPSGIWVSKNNGLTFSKFHTPSNNLKLRKFAGGRDENGRTLAYSDNNGKNACSWVNNFSDYGNDAINETTNSCGYLWISKSSGAFTKSSQEVGDHLKMAENDSQVLYVTGARDWIRQYGTKVFVSSDAGETFQLKLNQINWDVVPYAPWPKDKIDYSAVALDVGWWDNGYESFEINRRDSKVVAGSGYFFLHSSVNKGENWQSSISRFEDSGEREAGKKWQTTGLEVISVYRVKFHPANSNLIYAASADIAGVVSEDGGDSFRITKAEYNSNYDYAFDPRDEDKVFAASGNQHDWPNEWYANATKNAGGIYVSDDRGKNWDRLTPRNGDLNRQFLSVAYDPINDNIFGGTHETGIVRSTDSGKTWDYLNNGLPSGKKIIPQIEIDPQTGDAYALLTGDAPTFSNQEHTGIYYLKAGETSWTLLRKAVNYPPEADKGYKVWYYPTSFAIDFSNPNHMWLADYENNRNWLMTGIWKSIDRGQTWNRVLQLTHATHVAIDKNIPGHIFASGYNTMDGTWGNGGQFFSVNGGENWEKNLTPPLQQNARSVTIHPTDSKRLIYSYFGGGMLIGPNPAQNK